MPRYVLLRHECPPDYRDGPHWDLMLEHAGRLRTWSLLELPAAWTGGQGPASVTAKLLADHRLAYLEYEGEVSGGRGSVKSIAQGEYEGDVTSASCIEITATGDLAGAWRMTRTENAWRIEALK